MSATISMKRYLGIVNESARLRAALEAVANSDTVREARGIAQLALMGPRPNEQPQKYTGGNFGETTT